MNNKLLYAHPDGSSVEFNKSNGFLVVSGLVEDDQEDLECVLVPIGPVGLIELGKKLIELGNSL